MHGPGCGDQGAEVESVGVQARPSTLASSTPPPTSTMASRSSISAGTHAERAGNSPAGQMEGPILTYSSVLGGGYFL